MVKAVPLTVALSTTKFLRPSAVMDKVKVALPPTATSPKLRLGGVTRWPKLTFWHRTKKEIDKITAKMCGIGEVFFMFGPFPAINSRCVDGIWGRFRPVLLVVRIG